LEELILRAIIFSQSIRKQQIAERGASEDKSVLIIFSQSLNISTLVREQAGMLAKARAQKQFSKAAATSIVTRNFSSNFHK